MMINSSATTQLAAIRNIVVVGDSGVGKSSLINLITGTENAATSNNVHGKTLGTECHDWVSDTQTFRLWDTPGLNEGSFGTVSPKQAQDVLQSLLTKLTKGGGVHLLVLCMRGLPRVTGEMKQTYNTIMEIRDKVAPKVPVIAVITHLEERSSAQDIIPSMEEWWANNVTTLSDFNMLFSAHACITTLRDNDHPKKPRRRELCQELVRRRIVAQTLAHNIVIVGETGAGKSSLVNLVIGSEQAIVAEDLKPVTITTSSYDWETESETFRLWDTPGLVEGLNGSGLQKRPLDALRTLFTDLKERGGVHLLIICIRELSRQTKRTYDLIMNTRSRFSPMTPVVAVITGLEDQSSTFDTSRSMEEWWVAKAGELSDLGMSFSNHTCITNLPDDYHPQLPGRRAMCQELVRNLIRSPIISSATSAGGDRPATLVDHNVTAPPQPTTHPEFGSPDADVDLVSRDLIRFRMHSFTLKTTSGWFRSLFSMPRPSNTAGSRDARPALTPSISDPETIHLDEESSTLELLFRMISGLPIQPLTSFDTVDTLLFASEKYDMPGPMSLVRISVLTSPLADQPLRLYAAASRYGWTEEAKVASQRTLAMDLWQDDNWEMLAKVDVRSTLALLKLHRSRRDILRKKLDEYPFVNASPVPDCSRCRRPVDHHAWRELKHKVIAEMDLRPLGDTILDVGLTEWAEAKACWESRCAYADCAILQYDKTESMRLIKRCIDNLPKTT